MHNLSLQKLSLTPRFTDAHKSAYDALKKDGYGDVLAKILAARRVCKADDLDFSAQHLLPAADLKNIDAAVDAIDFAIDKGERILVVGDFDCDGATSTALCVKVLKNMDAKVDFLVPDRFVYGYGLTPKLVDFAQQKYKPKLIITVDNGISSFEGVDKAHYYGIKVVITDHHLAPDVTPNACAVVNPNQKGCNFASKALVGVGVAFYVMGALAKKRRILGKKSTQVSQFLYLVALGTVADIGALDKNNRILVALGLTQIVQNKACAGIYALLELAQKSAHDLLAQDLGFILAPRINAAGRMDNMRIGVLCLLSDDAYKAKDLAKILDEFNKKRRSIEADMRAKAEQILQDMPKKDTVESDAQKSAFDSDYAVVLYDDRWHQGVIGIVAGRIKDLTYRPSIIFAPEDMQKTGDDDKIKGSARSIAGVHIRDVLVQINDAHPDLICYFGGHAAAAGLTIYKKDFARFAKVFKNTVASLKKDVFYKTTYSDGALSSGELTLDFAYTLNSMLWGQNFFAPSFDNVFTVLEFKILKEKHLKLQLQFLGTTYPITAIYFNYPTEKFHWQAKKVHILYTLNINKWQGYENLQLIIQDLSVIELE